MAKIQGLNVVLELSTNGSNWYYMICEIDHGINQTRSTTETQTKCNNGETEVGLGAKAWEITGSAIVDDGPSATQMSYKSLQSHWDAGTLLYVRSQSPGTGSSAGAALYHKGQCYVTALNLTAAVDGAIQFDFTLKGTGNLSIAP